MHLCYLLPPIEPFSPQTGGALATFSFQQGRRLLQQGHRVSVIAPRTPAATYDMGEVVTLPGVTPQTLSPLQRALSSRVRKRFNRNDLNYYEHYRAAFDRALRELRPDVILCFNEWHTPRDAKASCPNARVFLRLSNECNTRLDDLSPTLDALERIFAVSGYIRDWTSERFDIPAAKFAVLPNGADLDSFFPAPDFIERVQAPDAPLRALFLSRLDPNKGPDLALQGVEIARAAGCPIELSIAGNLWFNNNAGGNAFTNELRARAQSIGAQLPGHIERPDVPALMRAHDIFLLPVRSNDPMPQAVFEAMASGLAVVSCPLGGLPEACGEAALWATPGDGASVGALVQSLCQDRALLVEHKNRSIERARQMTWDHNLARFQAVLNGEA